MTSPRLLLVAMAALFLLPQAADAQQRRRRQQQPAATEEGAPAEVPTLEDLASIVPKLSSENADEVREAIDLLAIIDRPEVIPHIEQLLRSGQPDAITDRALEALGVLAHASAIDVLAAFTHHRRAGARRRAYQALAAIQDRRIPDLLERGLADSDRNVRATVALSLGDIGARGSLDILFRAFERGVVEAAIAIGKLGNRQSITRFDEYLGTRPLSIMLSGYNEFLRRNDIPVEAKTEIVAKLGEVAGPMVKRFLQDYLGTFSERDRSALRRAVEETARRIPDDPNAGTRLPAGSAPPAGGAAQ